MLTCSLNGHWRPGRLRSNPSKMSHTEESANYKTPSGTSGSSTPYQINGTELLRQAPPETPARADKGSKREILIGNNWQTWCICKISLTGSELVPTRKVVSS